MPTADNPTTRLSPRALAVAGLGTMLTLVAFTAPLATLNATSAALGTDTAGRTWILSSMSIGLSAALLSTGTIADDFGRRRTFIIGMVVLAVGSLVSALAPDVLIFVLARVVQGLGSAAVIASSLGIIAHTFPTGPARTHASGVWGASVGAGIAIGPLLSATLDRVADWRSIYWVLGVAALVLAVLARQRVDESRSDQPRGLDLPGALLLAGGMTCLLVALVEGRQGWVRPDVVGLFVASAVLLALFAVVEIRSPSGLLWASPHWEQRILNMAEVPPRPADRGHGQRHPQRRPGTRSCRQRPARTGRHGQRCQQHRTLCSVGHRHHRRRGGRCPSRQRFGHSRPRRRMEHSGHIDRCRLNRRSGSSS